MARFPPLSSQPQLVPHEPALPRWKKKNKKNKKGPDSCGFVLILPSPELPLQESGQAGGKLLRSLPLGKRLLALLLAGKHLQSFRSLGEAEGARKNRQPWDLLLLTISSFWGLTHAF